MKTKFSNSWETHNITPEVGRYAERLGLDCMSTGGGCDYVCRFFPIHESDEKVEVTLASDEDGLSPKTLDERCSVLIHMGSGGAPSPWLQFDFKDAREAMKWMKDMPLGAAGLPD